MLDMKRLRLLRELQARGTIRAVAEALNYSPSAVSQQLSLLEAESDTQLLRKVGRNVVLTAAGDVLANEAEGLLAGLERAEAALHRARDEVRGTVRIAAFQSAFLALIPAALQILRARAPKLRLEVLHWEPGEALQETAARGFDLVIAEEYPGHSRAFLAGLDRVPLVHDPILLALPPHGAGDPRFDATQELGELAGLPWVLEPAGTATRSWAEQLCRAAGFEPDVRFETSDLQAHHRLIATGNAAGVLPGLAHVSGAVRLVPLPGNPRRTVFSAARAAQQGHPALAAVRTALAEAAAAHREPAGD
ncbi:LysR substrate-binding domain-containing protein [Leucobacter chromiireducens]|uniref:LysR family transcriptional regulator n=1 Tax=Leucobacter chromiireducens subsp. solipictus TaxID=398235 RepID=A0ABS1SHE5_9MICO|nr:LysR family transcriptional regulator [Leucobacter chromiireducens subsp. solipictus]